MRVKPEWEPFWSDDEGAWRVDFRTPAGRRVRRRLAVYQKGRRAEARRVAEELWQEFCNRDAPRTARALGGQTFSAAAVAYVEAGHEVRFLEPLVRYMGPATLVQDIDEALIDECGLELYPDAAPATRQRQVRTPIRAILNYALGKRRRRGVDRVRIEWLTPEDAEALIAAAARLRLPNHKKPEPFTLQKIAALLGSGWRTGECFVADVADYNAATRQWWTPGKEPGAGKSDGAARWISLPQRSIDLIGELPIAGRAFRTAYGKAIVMRKNGGGQMKESFDRARDAAGLPKSITPHTLRHTWATWFYAQTKDFGALMDLGGWTKADTAMRYRKLAPADLADRLFEHGWDFSTFGQKVVNSPASPVRVIDKKQEIRR